MDDQGCKITPLEKLFLNTKMEFISSGWQGLDEVTRENIKIKNKTANISLILFLKIKES